jgi:hypothetical protein
MMGNDLIEMKSYNNALVCEMVNREATCNWLDWLLDDRDFKRSYAIRGSHKQNTPKMKIYIDVGYTARA